MDLDRLKARAAEIAEKETKEWLGRTQAVRDGCTSGRSKTLPNGVVSNFQAGDPYPVYLEHGKGSTVTDVDGNDYTDFHGGFGVNVVGHAHPKIVEAIKKAADDAIHFAVTTETTVALAEEICERFQCEQMRFVNSGTEATMDAIRVARAATGRDKIIKMEGSLPRPPRLGAVLGRARGRRARPAAHRRRERQALVHHAADLQGRAAGAVGHRRSSCRSTTPRPSRRPSPTTRARSRR